MLKPSSAGGPLPRVLYYRARVFDQVVSRPCLNEIALNLVHMYTHMYKITMPNPSLFERFAVHVAAP